VVVVVGSTLVDPFAELDVKVPGEIVMLVAPDVVQLNVLLEPALIPVGLATNEEMVGAEPMPDPPRELDELTPPQATIAAHKKKAMIEVQTSAFGKVKS
jgi:hypothetical protein